MPIKIDKNVPIPSKRTYAASETLEEIKALEVNDSFLVDNPNNLSIKQLRNQTNSKMNYYGKQLDYKFSARVTVEGLRVWRTK